jgi:hypothetical protein
MKTNDKDIEKMHREEFGNRPCQYSNAESVHWDYTLGGYRAGFKACEAKMLTEAASGFEGFYKSSVQDEFDYSSMRADEKALRLMDMRKAFTAGAMSQVKKIEELEGALATVINISDGIMGTHDYEIIGDIRDKYLGKGSER